jgi:hypothetical protein
MRRNALAYAIALLAVSILGSSLTAGPLEAKSGIGASRGGAPFARWFHSAPPPAVQTQNLGLEEGWRPIGFSVGEPVSGLYLRVWGRVQFDRAEIVFRDGELEVVDLRQCVRSGGLYVLTEFDARREVMGVRMVVRARSDFAYVALKLGGDLLGEPGTPATAAAH